MVTMDTQITRFYLSLTPRQREVARLASKGFSNKEIAEALCIAPSVVAGHLSVVYAEMDICLPGHGNKRYALIRALAPLLERYPMLDV